MVHLNPCYIIQGICDVCQAILLTVKRDYNLMKQIRTGYCHFKRSQITKIIIVISNCFYLVYLYSTVSRMLFFFMLNIFLNYVSYIFRLTHSFWTQRYLTNIRQTWDLGYLLNWLGLPSEEFGKNIKNSLCPSIPYAYSAVPHCFPPKFSMDLTINCSVGLFFFFKLQVIG